MMTLILHLISQWIICDWLFNCTVVRQALDKFGAGQVEQAVDWIISQSFGGDEDMDYSSFV